jgi:hypothetical protein
MVELKCVKAFVIATLKALAAEVFYGQLLSFGPKSINSAL